VSEQGPDNQTKSLRMLLKVVRAGNAPSKSAIKYYVPALSFAIHRLENPEPQQEVSRAYSRGYQAGAKQVDARFTELRDALRRYAESDDESLAEVLELAGLLE